MPFHSPEQIRDVIQRHLLPGATDDDAPSGLLVLIDVVNLERQDRLLHRQALRAAFHPDDNVLARHRVIDWYRYRPEVILVNEPPNVRRGQQLAALIGRELFEFPLRHLPSVYRRLAWLQGTRS